MKIKTMILLALLLVAFSSFSFAEEINGYFYTEGVSDTNLVYRTFNRDNTVYDEVILENLGYIEGITKIPNTDTYFILYRPSANLIFRVLWTTDNFKTLNHTAEFSYTTSYVSIRYNETQNVIELVSSSSAVSTGKHMLLSDIYSNIGVLRENTWVDSRISYLYRDRISQGFEDDHYLVGLDGSSSIIRIFNKQAQTAINSTDVYIGELALRYKKNGLDVIIKNVGSSSSMFRILSIVDGNSTGQDLYLDFKADIIIRDSQNRYYAISYTLGKKVEITDNGNVLVLGTTQNFTALDIDYPINNYIYEDQNYYYTTAYSNSSYSLYKIPKSDLNNPIFLTTAEKYPLTFDSRSLLTQPTESGYIIYKDANQVYFEDVQPILDGRLIPLRGFALSIDFEIYWDQEAKQGVIRKNDGGLLKEIIFTKDSSTVNVNGKDYVMSSPATIIQGRFMIPARDLVMAFATVEYKDVVISPTSVKGEFYDSDFNPKPDGLDVKWEDIPTITEYQERDLVPLSKGIEEILAYNYDDESRQIIQDANGQVPVVLNVEPLMIVIAVPSKMPVHKLRDGSYATLSGGLSIQNLTPARIKIGNVRFECSEGWQLLDIETQKTEIIGGKVGNKKYGAAVGFGSIQKMVKVLPVIKRPDIDVSEWDMMNSFDSLAIFYRFEFAGSATPRSLIPSKMIIEFEFDSVD